MKRAAKGSGSVTRKANGKWLAKVPVGSNSQGKTRFVTVTRSTKVEARRAQMDMLAQRQNEMLVAGPRQTLRQYATEVLLNNNDRLSDRTRDGYFRLLRKHVFPVLGARTLNEVRPQDVDRLLKQMRREYSASTVNNVRGALSKVFSIAKRHDLVRSNPISGTEKARRREFERTQVCPPWTKEELGAALAAAKGSQFEAFIVLACATGMRRGELLGLKWSDIDFENQMVAITRTVHRESIIQMDGSICGRIVDAPPKTANSRRVNQLSFPILDVLMRHQAMQDIEKSASGDNWQGTGYVFTNSCGGALDESRFYKRYVKFLEDNAIRRIRIHDIRHTFATILIEEDASQLASVSKALGHSSIAITLDTYARTARVETKATSRMTEIMFPEFGHVEPISVPEPRKVGSVAPGHRRST
jgi:integrase